MVGIIFIFIIIVMSLVLQIKDRQKIISPELFEKMVNLSDQEMTEVEVMIDNKDDFSKTVKDLATEKNVNRDLKNQLEVAKKTIAEQINKIESFEELEKQNEILKKDISNSKNILTEYQKEIDNLSLQLTDIKEKDLEISVLEDTIKKLEKDINTSQQTITNNIKEISELEKDILEINVNNKEKI